MKNGLSIIIVNWNSGQQLADCVVSILQSKQECFVLGSLVIVDNASTDNSLGLLPQDDRICIIRNSVNYGFGSACNIGAKSVCEDELLLFLNPDTILNANTLEYVARFFVKNAEIMKFGIVGVKLVYENGKIQHSCSRFPSLASEFFDRTGMSKLFTSKSFHMNEFTHMYSRSVDQVMGAFFLTTNKLFNMLGGFDEQFFVYYEEVDFSYRAKQLGYNSYFLADVSAMHVGGGCSQQVKAHRLFYSLNSRLIYTKKHFSTIEHLLVCGLTLIVEPFTRVIFSLLKQDFRGIKGTLSGYKMLYKKKFS